MMASMFVALLCLCLVQTGKAFKFLSIGDWGTGDPAQYVVADTMADWANQTQYQFIVSTGDNFYDIPGDYPPIDFVNHTFFNIRWRDIYNHTSLVNMSWLQSVGNHDYCELDFESVHNDCEWTQVEYSQVDQRWVLPHLWYTQYHDTPAGRLHLIIIDTQNWQFGKNDPDTQENWLRDQLMNSQGVVKIVVAHHPLYSAGRYGPDLHFIEGLEELLYQYNVDMYLTGHDHNLQHLQYMNGTGPEFVVTGGGGRRLYAQDTEDSELEEVGVRRVHFEHDYGFTELEIQASSLSFRHINALGEVVYSHSRQLGSKI